MDEKDEEELKKLLSERKKWKIFFEILTRKYVAISIIALIFLLKESAPIPGLDHIFKAITRMFGMH